MALNGKLKKGEREEAERRLAELNDKKFKIIFGLLYKVNEKVDLFAKYNVDELFECRILSVDENHRGKGLANILMADSVETARNAGFKVFLTRDLFVHVRAGVSDVGNIEAERPKIQRPNSFALIDFIDVIKKRKKREKRRGRSKNAEFPPLFSFR